MIGIVPQDLLERALGLPAEVRESLVQSLSESLERPESPEEVLAYREFIRVRTERARSGQERSRDCLEVLAEIEARLRGATTP